MVEDNRISAGMQEGSTSHLLVRVLLNIMVSYRQDRMQRKTSAPSIKHVTGSGEASKIDSAHAR